MLSFAKMPTVLERKDADNRNIPVDIEFVKLSDGSLNSASQVRLLTYDKINDNYRFQWPSGRIRDIKKLSITKINNHVIYF